MRYRALVLAVVVAGCSRGPFAAVPYFDSPAGGDTATGFGGIDRALRELRDHRVVEHNARAPIALTTTDGNGLVLRSLHARAVIDGPLAVTELELAFDNPEDRQREGRFTIALPDGAAVSRLAMLIDHQWMEAEVVPRPRAREVYESHLRPKPRDPALLERDAGNVFSARIFPIDPHATKQVVVTYAQEVSATRPFRLHLAGLSAIDDLDVSVAGGAVPIAIKGGAGAPQDVVVATTGADAVVAGTAVVMRVAPALQTPTEPITALTILVDTSASRAGVLRAQAEAIRDLVTALDRRGLTRVAVAAYDQTVVPITAGSPRAVASEVVDLLVARSALGASDLGAALAWAAGRGDRVLVVGDGIATAGALEPPAIAAAAVGLPRVDALVLGGRGDREGLLAVVGGGAHPGTILDDTMIGAAGQVDVGTWADRLERGGLADVPVAVTGATWSWPERLESIEPGDEVVVMARFPDGTAVPRQVTVRLGDQTVTVPARTAPAALVDRTVVAADITRRRRQLATLPEDERDAMVQELTELAVEHRLLTDETGLLVLETEADYARWCLDRTALADVLMVDGGQIKVIDRSGNREPMMSCMSPPDAPATGPASITGLLRDRTGEALIGATVVATSPALVGEQVQITDEDGRYVLRGLPPGVYDLTIYYMDQTFTRHGIAVTVATGTEELAGAPGPAAPAAASATSDDDLGVAFSGATSTRTAYVIDAAPAARADTFAGASVANVSVTVDPNRGGGELLTISGSAPMIDQGSTTTSTTIEEYTYRVTGDYHGIYFHPTPPDFSGYVDDSDWEPKVPAGGKPAWSGKLAYVMAEIADGDADRAVGDALGWQLAAPADLLAVVALGTALEARGNPALAARAYGSILDLFPRRAELVRAAGERLERVGATELALAAYRRAVADRPDQASGHRLLAWALVRAGDLDGALAEIEAAYDAGGSMSGGWSTLDAYRADFAMIAAAIARRTPGRMGELTRRATTVGATIDTAPRVRFVLHWETDASDLDLHVTDRRNNRAWDEDRRLGKHGSISATAEAGWGPEEFSMPLADAHQGPYRLMAYLDDAGPQGHVLGTLQIIESDGKGGFTFEHRPFVITEADTYIDLGTY